MPNNDAIRTWELMAPVCKYRTVGINCHRCGYYDRATSDRPCVMEWCPVLTLSFAKEITK